MLKASRNSLYLLFLVIPLLISGCEPGLIEKIEGHFHSQNKLIYQVGFSLNDRGEAFIEYWMRNDSTRMYSGLSPDSKDHKISIFNLLPDTTYYYRVWINQNNKIRESESYTFRTDTLPSQLPVYDLIKDNFDFEDYILLKAFHDPGALVILNRDARIVWYHLYDSSVVRPFEFTFDRNILSLVDSSIIEETSLDGRLLRRIDTNEHGIDRIHHELFKNIKSQYIGLTYTEKIMDLSV